MKKENSFFPSTKNATNKWKGRGRNQSPWCIFVIYKNACPVKIFPKKKLKTKNKAIYIYKKVKKKIN